MALTNVPVPVPVAHEEKQPSPTPLSVSKGSEPCSSGQVNNGALESPIAVAGGSHSKSSSSSENRKKKHHKRSRRLESHDSSVRTEHSSVDYESLVSSVRGPARATPLLPAPVKFTVYPGPPAEIPEKEGAPPKKKNKLSCTWCHRRGHAFLECYFRLRNEVKCHACWGGERKRFCHR